MRLSQLTLLINEVNALIDTNKYSDIGLDDVKNAMREKGLLRYLQKKGGQDIDLSLHLDPKSSFEREYEERMQSIREAYGGNESRKWGVENHGLCLVVAWTVEILQQRQGVEF
jgi:hypothetical protein